MIECEPDLNAWISVIKGEYREMPGLQLTKAQVRRMWALEDAECELVLSELQAADFIRLNARGCYVLADHDHAPLLAR